jgi:outer membrane immunogenic protein
VKKNLVPTILIAALIATPAVAADMAVKAPPVAPAPAFSWTGFYLGGELGAESGRSRWTTTSLFNVGFPTTGIDASSPRNFDALSARAGAYLGYNWQLAPRWIGGVEVDAAYANAKRTTVGLPGCTILCTAPFAGIAVGPDQAAVRLGWDGSARLRLGYLVTPDTLLYGTGGIAWQNIQASATCAHSAADPLCFLLPGSPIATATNTAVRAGWTAGLGFEWHVRDNWIARAEYRYAQFDSSGLLNLGLPLVTTTLGYSLRTGTNIATLGLAYKFGGGM